MSTTAEVSARPGADSALVAGFRGFAALATLIVVLQGVTAGQLFSAGGGGVAPVLHAAGAIALHVTSGLAAICAGLLWRRGRLGIGITGLAAAVFAFGFVQAAIGGFRTLYVHVPGALLLTAGTAALAVMAWRRPVTS